MGLICPPKSLEWAVFSATICVYVCALQGSCRQEGGGNLWCGQGYLADQRGVNSDSCNNTSVSAISNAQIPEMSRRSAT